MIARHVVVRGLVQGVFYRASCGEVARQHHVAGWVANQPDGSVEAWFEGDPDAVEAVLAWCHEGPRHADVTSVDADEVEPTGASTFEVR